MNGLLKLKFQCLFPLVLKVAIKILEKKKITDKADMERLAREINILKTLRHPNIIQLYQVLSFLKEFVKNVD